MQHSRAQGQPQKVEIITKVGDIPKEEVGCKSPSRHFSTNYTIVCKGNMCQDELQVIGVQHTKGKGMYEQT